MVAYFHQYEGYTPAMMKVFVMRLGYTEGNYRAAKACIDAEKRGMTTEPVREIGSDVR